MTLSQNVDAKQISTGRRAASIGFVNQDRVVD
jgi:hypothetical protein